MGEHAMQAKMRIYPAEEGQSKISITVPADRAGALAEALRSALSQAGFTVRETGPDGEETVSAEEVFGDASPAMALRGFRGKMGWTQGELAERLGTTEDSVCAMESGRRSISLEMAKRLEQLFHIPYKVFL